MKRQEWMRRYRAQFKVIRPDLNDLYLDQMIVSLTFDYLRKDFAEEPEVAADHQLLIAKSDIAKSDARRVGGSS